MSSCLFLNIETLEPIRTGSELDEPFCKPLPTFRRGGTFFLFRVYTLLFRIIYISGDQLLFHQVALMHVSKLQECKSLVGQVAECNFQVA